MSPLERKALITGVAVGLVVAAGAAARAFGVVDFAISTLAYAGAAIDERPEPVCEHPVDRRSIPMIRFGQRHTICLNCGDIQDGDAQ